MLVRWLLDSGEFDAMDEEHHRDRAGHALVVPEVLMAAQPGGQRRAVPSGIPQPARLAVIVSRASSALARASSVRAVGFATPCSMRLTTL
jgi:hypothetical protein